MPTQRLVPVMSLFGADTGGGLVALTDDGLESLDDLSTTGMCLTDTGFARLMRSEPGTSSVAELVVYDDVGLSWYRRYDGIPDPHDLLWIDGSFLVVSSHDNAVVRLDVDGTTGIVWQPTTVPDAWHPNCLTVVDSQLWITAFGQFATSRAWAGDGARSHGFLRNLQTGEELGGLTQPHSPRFVDGSWWVCESLDYGLIELDPRDGSIRRSVTLEGYTRGLAFDDDHVYVGESGRRDPVAWPHARASLAVLRRDDLSLVKRHPLPAREVFDVVLVPERVLDALRLGERVNPTRVNERAHRRALVGDHGESFLLPTGLPLPPDACRVEVDGDYPAVIDAGRRHTATVTIRNIGSAVLASLDPCPVHIAAKWLDHGDGKVVDGERARFRRPLHPGRDLEVTVDIGAPRSPGRYQLTVTAVQEQVFWFDDLHADNAWSTDVLVVAP